MIFFSESGSLPNATDRAVRMALLLRTRFVGLAREWRQCGHALGLGIGVSKGDATIGIIGFDGRWDFGVIGPADESRGTSLSAGESRRDPHLSRGWPPSSAPRSRLSAIARCG